MHCFAAFPLPPIRQNETLSPNHTVDIDVLPPPNNEFETILIRLTGDEYWNVSLEKEVNATLSLDRVEVTFEDLIPGRRYNASAVSVIQRVESEIVHLGFITIRKCKH